MAQAGTQVQATVTQVASAELLSNTTFESGVTGWESNTAFGAYVAAAVAQSGAVAHGGSFSGRATWPDGNGKRSVINSVFSTTVGNLYTFSGWAYVPSGSQDVQPVVFFMKAGAPITTKDAWTFFSVSFIATGTGHFVGLETVDEAVSGGVCYIDDASGKAPFAITVDGATRPCPAARLDSASYTLNQRVTVTVRNPLIPLIQGVETV